MEHPRIAFIGGGNMTRSLLGGLVADGYPRERLTVADPDEGQRRALCDGLGIAAGADNAAIAAAADVVVIAVKPQVVAGVARELAPALGGTGKLVISIAAGIRTAALDAWLGSGSAIVRAMPNTPALVQSAATVLFATDRTDAGQREAAETVLRAVGLIEWVTDESLMDAVTALSGSGPAYFFLVMEALEETASRLGLPAETARLLTVQTAFGAAKMALESTASGPGELRAQVTSPGGTTERALEVLRSGDLQGLFGRALTAARDRSVELSNLLGKEPHDR